MKKRMERYFKENIDVLIEGEDESSDIEYNVHFEYSNHGWWEIQDIYVDNKRVAPDMKSQLIIEEEVGEWVSCNYYLDDLDYED